MGFGLYSYRGRGRRTKDDLLKSAPFGYTDAKLWGHNRLMVTYPDRVEYRLHDTTVVKKMADGALVVDDGGYPTITTSAAIRQALQLATGAPATFWRTRKSHGALWLNGRDVVGPLPLTIRPCSP
jgi:hypothetical protein